MGVKSEDEAFWRGFAEGRASVPAQSLVESIAREEHRAKKALKEIMSALIDVMYTCAHAEGSPCDNCRRAYALIAKLNAGTTECACRSDWPDASDESFDQYACADCHAEAKARGHAP